MAATLWGQERKSKKVRRPAQEPHTSTKEFQKENGENNGEEIDKEAFQTFI